MRRMRLLTCACLFVLAVLRVTPGTAQTGQRRVDLGGLSRSLQSVVAKLAPAVVQIQVVAYGPVNAGATGPGALLGTQRSTGSGVVLSPDGFIVTNAHVIAGGRRFLVVLPRPAVAGAPNRSVLAPVSLEVPAKLVGVDQETDLAVLKVDLKELPFARLGDSDSLAPGQVVLAFGSPFGLASSVTMGVVSAVGRQFRDEDRMVYIQTDTPINPGNSGGPLVSADGVVVGINTLILSQSGGSEGIGFAAPANIVRFIYDQLRTRGRVRRSEIGVFAQTITPALAGGIRLGREWGVVLADVYPDSPAAKAGLRIGDVILSVEGKPMENARQFDVNLYGRIPGNTVRLEVGRGLQRLTISVTVVERRNQADRFRDLVTPEQNLISQLGILGLDLTPELAGMIPGIRDPHGVVVAGVASQVAGGAGPLPGDVIYAVNGERVRTLAALRSALGPIGADSTAVLQVGRQGQLRFLTVTLE
jgi:serine protease Do